MAIQDQVLIILISTNSSQHQEILNWGHLKECQIKSHMLQVQGLMAAISHSKDILAQLLSLEQKEEVIIHFSKEELNQALAITIQLIDQEAQAL